MQTERGGRERGKKGWTDRQTAIGWKICNWFQQIEIHRKGLNSVYFYRQNENKDVSANFPLKMSILKINNNNKIILHCAHQNLQLYACAVVFSWPHLFYHWINKNGNSKKHAHSRLSSPHNRCIHLHCQNRSPCHCRWKRREWFLHRRLHWSSCPR